MRPMIELECLTRRFGSVEAVSGIELVVGEGEIFGLLGPNGAGKTTTLHMLCGVLRPSEGTARVGGADLGGDPLEIKRKVGFVPDAPHLFEYLTLWEYLSLVVQAHDLPRDTSRERALELLEWLQLTDVITSTMGGFSLGQRKKAALTAALLPRPPVLLLDEPTASLDPLATRQVEELVERQARAGVTVLLSTHILQSAESLCHRVAFMDRGRILAAGRPADLIEEARSRHPEEDIRTLVHLFDALVPMVRKPLSPDDPTSLPEPT